MKKHQNLITWVALILAIVFMLNMCSKIEPTPNGDQSSMAKVMCEEFVKKRLKSPSSAKFPWGNTARALGTEKYALVSYVDSQNSFGASLRTNFKCIVFDNKETNKWELLQLNME